MQIKVTHTTPFGTNANTPEKKLLNAIYEEKVVTVNIPADVDKVVLIHEPEDGDDDGG